MTYKTPVPSNVLYIRIETTKLLIHELSVLKRIGVKKKTFHVIPLQTQI